MSRWEANVQEYVKEETVNLLRGKISLKRTASKRKGLDWDHPGRRDRAQSERHHCPWGTVGEAQELQTLTLYRAGDLAWHSRTQGSPTRTGCTTLKEALHSGFCRVSLSSVSRLPLLSPSQLHSRCSGQLARPRQAVKLLCQQQSTCPKPQSAQHTFSFLGHTSPRAILRRDGSSAPTSSHDPSLLSCTCFLGK